MINLGGWDLITMTDAALVNQAMAARQNELIVGFEFRSDEAMLRGTFGPWRIVPGGSMGYLLVEMPVREGELRIRGKWPRARLEGVVLKARLRLRMLPVGDRGDRREVIFDLHELGDGEEGVDAIGYDDPEDHLQQIEAMVFRRAVAACLSAHAGDVSFVVASVETRGTVKGAEFEMPHHAWGNVLTGDGRQYLALAGALTTPKAPLSTVDPGIIATPGSAYLALSRRFLMIRVVHPALESGFRPRVPFRCRGAVSESTRPVSLGKQSLSGMTVEPILRRLSVEVGDTALLARAETKTDLALGTYLTTDVRMTMPFAFDRKTGTLTFRADPDPKVSHQVHGNGPFGWLAELLVGIILAWNADALKAMTRSLAGRMQGANLREVDTSTWTGVRDFEVGGAAMKRAMVLTDVRAAGEGARQAVTATTRPA